jgi:hypothetical protein
MSGELPQTGIDWIQILGISALVSGGISAFLNYLLTMRQFRKKTDMDLVQQKLDLYSTMIYHLDKMKYANDAIDFAYFKDQQPKQGNHQPKREMFVYTDTEWRALVQDIDSKLEDRYYLLNRRILEKWVWAKTLMTNPISIEVMPELRKMLVEEYNQVRKKHLNHIPDIVPEISPDPELKSTQIETVEDDTEKSSSS